MPRERFFVAGRHAIGARIALAPDDARKLLTVLRRRSGDRVQIVDGGGTVYGARLEVEGKAVHAVLDAPLADSAVETHARIVIAQAVPKGQKMDFIVEKATELGAAAIVPLHSKRVIGQTGDHKRERWQRIARAAAAQCGRNVVPAIEPPADWDALLATFGAYDRVYLAWESAPAQPLRESFEGDVPEASTILIVIGPEGGFSADEVEAAERAGAVPISLGRRILRTETAALVVFAALLYARGEL
jgi:16S rRNA (uracil1498-N3)-methyltransferase